ncbi:hypothetical protein FB451DRAFT_1191844 [Mycena latifolia]|nr:hypothetical protein FB451DRAFT_1191844 [Mycena latifolia]
MAQELASDSQDPRPKYEKYDGCQVRCTSKVGPCFHPRGGGVVRCARPKVVSCTASYGSSMRTTPKTITARLGTKYPSGLQTINVHIDTRVFRLGSIVNGNQQELVQLFCWIAFWRRCKISSVAEHRGVLRHSEACHWTAKCVSRNGEYACPVPLGEGILRRAQEDQVEKDGPKIPGSGPAVFRLPSRWVRQIQGKASIQLNSANGKASRWVNLGSRSLRGSAEFKIWGTSIKKPQQPSPRYRAVSRDHIFIKTASEHFPVVRLLRLEIPPTARERSERYCPITSGTRLPMGVQTSQPSQTIGGKKVGMFGIKVLIAEITVGLYVVRELFAVQLSKVVSDIGSGRGRPSERLESRAPPREATVTSKSRCNHPIKRSRSLQRNRDPNIRHQSRALPPDMINSTGDGHHSIKSRQLWTCLARRKGPKESTEI